MTQLPPPPPQPISLGQALQQAAAALGRGDARSAEALCRRVLQLRPALFEAQYLLGHALAQAGQPAQAEQVLVQAMGQRPNEPVLLAEHAALLLRLGRPAEALAQLEAAGALAPLSAESQFRRGNALKALGRHAEAVAAYDLALQARPGYAEALCNRGNALLALGRPAEAVASQEAALQLAPGMAAAQLSRGVALLAAGRHAAAVLAFERLVARDPSQPEPHRHLGDALLGLGRAEEAMRSYGRALALRPSDALALCHRAEAWRRLHRPDEAQADAHQAVALAPELAETHHVLGNVLQDRGELAASIACYDRALARDPGLAEAHYNAANALRLAERPDEAIERYDQALRLAPGHLDAWLDRGTTLHRMNRPAEAIACFERVIAARPAHAEAHVNLGYCHLMQGDWAAGWPQYEWRLQTADFRAAARDFGVPRWTGTEPLAGRTILLHAEQGLGDAIQFSRFAAPLAAQGARVVLEVPAPLQRLLAGAPGVAQCVARGDALPPLDCHCPLMSLPLALGTTPQTVPSPAGYLQAAPALVASWQQRLGPRQRPRLGLMWAGGDNPKLLHRSLPLAQAVTLLGAGWEVISLQKDLRAADAASLAQWSSVPGGPALRHFGAEQQDLADAAALVAAVDLVVSVDTSIAHLAGALGKPVWVLLPHAADWRWLMDRDDSPWYASARLYRQPRPGDWATVLQQVRRDLAS
ncbi:tetratricopeptide repeat protein [Aquabacterium sp.]|uniref:tetratricopeptide repeat protein n=1 Tax=Aquabacterium sp. TaxID=1872578 RepID=UPI003784FA3B